MAVYFIHEQPEEYIKVGVSHNPPTRVRNLQTGNPRPLELLGWIQTDGDQDFQLEGVLHSKFEQLHVSGEWFALHTGVVLDELRRAGINGFVAKNADAFEIAGRDRDGIPEFVGVCNWVDLGFKSAALTVDACAECMNRRRMGCSIACTATS